MVLLDVKMLKLDLHSLESLTGVKVGNLLCLVHQPAVPSLGSLGRVRLEPPSEPAHVCVFPLLQLYTNVTHHHVSLEPAACSSEPMQPEPSQTPL